MSVFCVYLVEMSLKKYCIYHWWICSFVVANLCVMAMQILKIFVI